MNNRVREKGALEERERETEREGECTCTRTGRLDQTKRLHNSAGARGPRFFIWSGVICLCLTEWVRESCSLRVRGQKNSRVRE